MTIDDRQEILRQLDVKAENYVFPMLDNGYYYHADQKMSVFRDDKRWAILLEILAFFNHESGLDGITTIASVFGNCLIGRNEKSNFNYFASDNGVETFLTDDTIFLPYLNPKAKSILVRGQQIPIIFDRQHYKLKAIDLEHEDKITPWEFLRGLIPEHSNLFWVTREEISTKIPKDLSVFMILDSWHHPNLVEDEKPSETETFQQLADAIITGDKKLYNK